MELALSAVIKHSLCGGDLTPDLVMNVVNKYQVTPADLIAELEDRFVLDLCFLQNHLMQGIAAMRLPTLDFYAQQAKDACAHFNKTRHLINPAYVILRYAGAIKSNDLQFSTLLNNLRMHLWAFDGSCIPSLAERECALLAVHSTSEYVERSFGSKTSTTRCLLRCLYIVQCMLEGVTPLPPVLKVQTKSSKVAAKSRSGTLVRIGLCEFASIRALAADEKTSLMEKPRLISFLENCIDVNCCSFPLHLSFDSLNRIVTIPDVSELQRKMRIL